MEHLKEVFLMISIHVLRVEDDAIRFEFDTEFQIFQSTSSVWRTTGADGDDVVKAIISIHVLRVEDDCFPAGYEAQRDYFNPRPPCGGRRRPKRL